MPKLLLLCLFFVAIHGRAQQLPWKGLPATKKVLSLRDEDAGDSVTVYLKLDTLHKDPQPDERDWVSRRWYQAEAVGYGYRDKAGRPFGVWKYYTRSATGYELYCEGYYTLAQAERLLVDPDIQQQFASASSAENRAGFIASLADRLVFTDEWRFYQGGRLTKIVVLSDRPLLPYETSVRMTDDGSSVSANVLMVAAPQRRLAGQVLTTAEVSPEGYLKTLRTEGLSLDFDPKGKPVIYPLYNMD